MVNPVDSGQPMIMMGSAMSMGSVTDVKAADMQVGEASDDREKAEDKTYAETDEIEGVHTIWCSVERLFSSRLDSGDRNRNSLRTQNLEEAIEQRRRLDNGLDEKKTAARVGMVGYRQQRLAQCRISTKTFGSAHKPKIEFVLSSAQVRDQL